MDLITRIDDERLSGILREEDEWIMRDSLRAALQREADAVRERDTARKLLLDAVMEAQQGKGWASDNAHGGITHCDCCGGSWVDDGLNPGCPCLIKTERDDLRAIVSRIEVDQVTGQLFLSVLEVTHDMANKCARAPCAYLKEGK